MSDIPESADLTTARKQYESKFKKEVPTNKKNDLDWINSKVQEPAKETEDPTKVEEPEEKLPNGLFTKKGADGKDKTDVHGKVRYFKKVNGKTIQA